MVKTPILAKLFGPSPVTPIQHHMSTCEQCALEIIPFFTATFKRDWPLAERHGARITELELDADKLKKQIRMNLRRSLFLPVSRNNLLEIVQIQDRIANGTKDIAGLVIGRQLELPEPLQPLLAGFVEVSISAVTLARVAMDELNDLITTGFTGQEIEFVEKILERLHAAEHDADVQQIELRRALIDYEHELDAIDVMFIYKVIDRIGDVSDDAQTVGNRMMYLMAK
jgi:predicted phosphate transport protein (TIGR00153 family)